MNISRTITLSILLCGLLLCSVAKAQSLPQKDVLVLEPFARDRSVPRAFCETLRQGVGAAFEQRNRFQMADGSMETAGGNDIIDPMRANQELYAYLASHGEELFRKGVRFAVNGAVTNYKFEHVRLPGGENRPPIQGFKTSITLSIAAYDYRLGKPIDPYVMVLTASAPQADEADRAAMASIAGKLTFYIDRNFRFETTILDLCPPEGRKHIIKELYIHSGVEMGVTAGDTFNVYEERIIGGVSTRELVGRVRVNNVHDQGIARCKITKGNDQIIRAFSDGNPLICVSDTKALFY